MYTSRLTFDCPHNTTYALGPMPKNIYDKGIVSNFTEVLFPLSSGDIAIQRYKAALQEGQNVDTFNKNHQAFKPKTI